MSRGKQLQEMDPGTKQSKTAVNANAKAGEPIDTSAGNWEDLGGPTPENYKSTDDSAKLKTPGGNLKQVSDVVTNRKGKTAKEEVEVEDQEIVAEEPATEEEVVAENEVSTEEVVEEETVEEYDMEEDVNALLSGEELSEDFKSKASTIFEAHDKLGGMMRYGIPSYRTPDQFLDPEVKRILDMGHIEVKLNTTVGKDISLSEIENEYDAVLWAIGCWTGRPLPIPNSDAPNCISAKPKSIVSSRFFSSGNLSVS